MIVVRTIAPATPGPVPCNSELRTGHRSIAVEASCRGVYSVKRNLALALADTATLEVLGMAWRIAMEREGGKDAFNRGHLTEEPFDIRDRAGRDF